MIIYLAAILTTLALVVAVAAVYQLRYGRRVVDRLHRIVDNEPETITESLSEATLPAPVRAIAFLGWILPGQVYSEMLKWDLARAGYRHIDARRVFAELRVSSSTLLGLTGAVATTSSHASLQETLVVTALGLGVGYFLPAVVLHAKQVKRKTDLTLALPDAMDLLVICLEAGQGLNAALLKVGRESGFAARAIGEELRTMNAEMVAGVGRTQALRNWAMRTGVEDVRALVAVMIQSDRFGTSIVGALRIHAQSLRVKRRQRAEETARKTPVKLVFPLVFCIFPELLVVILAPGMLALYRALVELNR
jgi:tight adherence protein C